MAATAKPGIQLRPTPDGPPRARPGQRVTGPGATARPGIQLRPTPDGPPRARPGRKATGPGATARPGIQLRPTPDGPPRARPGQRVTGPGATAKPGIQLRPTPDGPPRARPGQRVTGPGATAKPGIQLRPTPGRPPRARPGQRVTGPGATARPGIQLRPTPDGPPRARPGRKVTGPGATARPGIQLPRDLERQLELARIVEGNRRREREAARAAAKAKAEEQTVATAAEEQTPAPTGDQRDDIRRRFNNACVDSRTGIKEIAADFGESLPRRLDWAAVDATMQDEEGDPRYQARTAGLDIGSARMGLERYLLEEARPYRPRGAAVADSVRAAITRIRETVDKFIEGILEKLLPDRGQPATPDRPAAATRAPVEQRTAPPAPETPEAAPVRGADEEPGGASRPRRPPTETATSSRSDAQGGEGRGRRGRPADPELRSEPRHGKTASPRTQARSAARAAARAELT